MSENEESKDEIVTSEHDTDVCAKCKQTIEMEYGDLDSTSETACEWFCYDCLPPEDRKGCHGKQYHDLGDGDCYDFFPCSCGRLACASHSSWTMGSGSYVRCLFCESKEFDGDEGDEGEDE